MKNDLKMVFFSHFLHHDHKHHVLVYGFYSLAIYRSTLELIRSHLVMTCLKKDPELICLRFKILHERTHTRRYCPEIVILKLLILC